MVKIFLSISVVLLMSCTTHSDNVNESRDFNDNNFELIDDFESSRQLFSTDTLPVDFKSTEGGQLIVLHSTKREYVVLDAWVYGEIGKIHTTFWMDRDSVIKIAKRTITQYDRPFYEPGFKEINTTEYFSYLGDEFRYYNGERNELNDSLNIKKTEIEDLFGELISIFGRNNSPK